MNYKSSRAEPEQFRSKAYLILNPLSQTAAHLYPLVKLAFKIDLLTIQSKRDRPPL